jgi:hypothetical protein
MYTRLVYIDTVGHDSTSRIRGSTLINLGSRGYDTQTPEVATYTYISPSPVSYSF